jgi:hypothetical protein
MDTVAKETVNYYGIGTFPQPHKLKIIAPLNIPFEGYLELHTLFFEEYACTFPLSIADTTTTGLGEITSMKNFSIYPNPASDVVNICFDETLLNQKLLLSIVDNVGRELCYYDVVSKETEVPLAGFNPGIYSIMLTNSDKQIIFTEKMIVR